LEEKTIHLVITSPPYWNIKDYGNKDQIGFNDSIETYFRKLNKGVFPDVEYGILKPKKAYHKFNQVWRFTNGTYNKPYLYDSKKGIYKKPFYDLVNILKSVLDNEVDGDKALVILYKDYIREIQKKFHQKNTQMLYMNGGITSKARIPMIILIT